MARDIWVPRRYLEAREIVSVRWQKLVESADLFVANPTVELEDQDANWNTLCMACAIVAARTNITMYIDAVMDAMEDLSVVTYSSSVDSLPLARNLAAYVIAADIIDVRNRDAALNVTLRATFTTLATTPTDTGTGPDGLVNTASQRPNNIGLMALASLCSVYAYTDDSANLETCAGILRTWTGETTEHTGYAFGADLSWHADPSAPIGVNPVNSTIEDDDAGGALRDVDGVLPDDQRRGGEFEWPAPMTEYPWEALQGAVTAALILKRRSYRSFEWGDYALSRAVRWLLDVAENVPDGDDRWVPGLVAANTPRAYPREILQAGKVVGWSDWTHDFAP